MKFKTEHIKKLALGVAFFMITFITLLFSVSTSVSAGVSEGYSSVEKPYSKKDDVVNALTSNTSFPRLAMNAANIQNSDARTSGAYAIVQLDYKIEAYVPDGSGGFKLEKEFTNSDEYAVQNSPEQRTTLKKEWVEAIYNQALADIDNYSGDALQFWLTFDLQSIYQQTTYIKAGSAPAYTNTLELRSTEKVSIECQKEPNGIATYTTLMGGMEIMGSGDYKVDMSYSTGRASGQSSVDFRAAVCDSRDEPSQVITVPKNYRLRMQAELNRKTLVVKNQLGRYTEYKTTGDDATLDDAIHRMIQAANGADMGIPVESSSTPESSKTESSSVSSSSGSSGSSSKDNDVSSSSSQSSISSSGSSSSTSSSESSEQSSNAGLLSGSSSSKAESSVPKKDEIESEKTTLQSLASKLGGEDSGGLLGGSLSGDMKNIVSENDIYTELIDMESGMAGTKGSGGQQDFGINDSTKYVFIFGTVLLIIAAIPLAWKFISKNQDAEFIG